MPAALSSSYAAALDVMLRRAHLMPPDQIGPLATLGARKLGAQSAVVWLVDYEQALLVPVVAPGEGSREQQSVDGSLAGRAFRVVEPVETSSDAGRRLWVPLLDGIERLGVLEVVFAADTPPWRTRCTACSASSPTWWPSCW